MEVMNQANRCCARDPSMMNIIFPIISVAVVILMGFGSVAQETTQTYIVYVEQPEMRPLTLDDRKNWYASFLSRGRSRSRSRSRSIANADEDSEYVESRMLYAYENVASAFAARLSNAELDAITELHGFVEAIPDTLLSLHTTYSPRVVGLAREEGLWPEAHFGKGVIIGVLDSGVWPESPSFTDLGVMPPVPPRWKGVCNFNSPAFACNNKLIGATVLNAGAKEIALEADDNPRDTAGHGTHTASIAAGNAVVDADVLGYGNGTASGMAPFAHLAIYKVCFGDTPLCTFSDVLAGIDRAISDGVDVLSISIGGEKPPLYDSVIAMGTFKAMEKGIFVACSAGNSGPDPSTVENDAPWITTVGAITMDRDFAGSVRLGDGSVFYGQTLNPGGKHKTLELALVHGGEDGSLCVDGSPGLSPNRIKGKLVICVPTDSDGSDDRIRMGVAVRAAGGAGMLLLNNVGSGEEVVADAHVLPTLHLGFTDGLAIKAYMNSTQSPTASIQSEGTVFGRRNNGGSVASFSSRGPSIASPGILKPDVIAPGASVVAAWPGNVSPSRLPRNEDERRVKFNTMSGTSMACPHVSGFAALLKSAHPDWSPSAIKSALMTTADLLDKNARPILDSATDKTADILATGAGRVNMKRAADPGLIYDIAPEEYVSYLCATLNSNATQVRRVIVNKSVTCRPPTPMTPHGDGDLNYPSFALTVTAVPVLITLKRQVTNVGDPNSTYTVNIAPPDGVKVTVNPSSLSLRAVKEKKSYNVTFAIQSFPPNSSHSFDQGFISWISSAHTVRSPISIFWSAN